MILLRYSPELGQLVDAEGKGIGVVCVPNFIESNGMRYVFEVSAQSHLVAATVTPPERAVIGDLRGDAFPYAIGFNAALDAIK